MPHQLFRLADKITQLNNSNYFIQMEEIPHFITKNDLIGQIFIFRETFYWSPPSVEILEKWLTRKASSLLFHNNWLPIHFDHTTEHSKLYCPFLH